MPTKTLTRTDPVSEELQSDATLLYAIKQVELASRRHLDGLLRPAGITSLQYTALTVLERREGLSSAELARNSFVTAQTMAEMVAALERRGLVSRERDPANRRRLNLSLTPAAHELLAEQRDRVERIEETMVAPLTARQRRDLREMLHRCRNALADVAAP